MGRDARRFAAKRKELPHEYTVQKSNNRRYSEAEPAAQPAFRFAGGPRAVMAQKMEKLDRNEDCFLLVAENTENGDLCGSLLGVAFEDICGDCKPILLVENVVTDEAYRGRGVGRGMFAFIEDWGREKECHYCILVSGLNRTGAHKFYDAIGYSEVKGFKKYL